VHEYPSGKGAVTAFTPLDWIINAITIAINTGNQLMSLQEVNITF
jgi:hypothetical protein